jgi:hypothetical protein
LKKRANVLPTPGYVWGVGSVGEAVRTISGLPANLPISKVYFVGHGNAQIFFMAGAPDGTDNFTATSDHDSIFTDPTASHNMLNPDPSENASSSMNLVSQLAKHFIPAGSAFEIAFLCCNSGINLVPDVASALKGLNVPNGTVGGYNNDYRTNFENGHWRDIIQTDDAKKTRLKKSTTDAPPAYDTTSTTSP